MAVNEQWVSRIVEFSSQYNATSWSAQNVVGEANVYPKYGDIPGAWTAGTVGANEYIVVEFAAKTFIQGIDIYETYNAGAVVRISAWNEANASWVELWRADNLAPQRIQQSRIFSPNLTKPSFPSNRLKLELNLTAAGTWCEIDAIKLKGSAASETAPKEVDSELWVENVVEFSSEYDTSSWTAKNVIGAPNVYPQYGDIRGTWTAGKTTANEYIVVEFAQKLFISGIDVYETYNGGAVVRISAWNESNASWAELWRADNLAPQRIQSSRIFSPPVTKLSFPSKRVKLELNLTAANTWCEIDAIKLKGKKAEGGKSQIIEQWVSNVRQFSSEYNATSWAARNVIGAPNVYPQYGDIQGTWTAGKVTANEFIEVEFTDKLVIGGIDIYETYNGGAVIRISAWNDANKAWVELWHADNLTPQRIQTSRIFSPPLAKVYFASNLVKLELNLTAAGTWCEIDAIKIRGTSADQLASIKLSDKYSYTDTGVDLSSQHSVTFQIKAASDAYVALTTTKDNYDGKIYEFVIGAFGNTCTLIRIAKQADMVASSSSLYVLDDEDFRPFWLSWSDGNIQVGKGSVVGKSTLASYGDEKPIKVNYLGVTCNGQQGEFRFA